MQRCLLETGARSTSTHYIYVVEQCILISKQHFLHCWNDCRVYRRGDSAAARERLPSASLTCLAANAALQPSFLLDLLDCHVILRAGAIKYPEVNARNHHQRCNSHHKNKNAR